jgi:hypothetical protein
MNISVDFIVTPWNESHGTCECCGRVSKTIWGDISLQGDSVAVYFIQWTMGASEHYPNVDIVFGAWGEGTDPGQRVLVSMLFRPAADGGSFMVIDGDGRPSDNRELCGRALKRIEVIGTSLAQEAFALVDAIWLQDPRIEEVKALNTMS